MNPPKFVKAAVRGVLTPVGLEVKQKGSSAWLKALGLRTVLDIGANEGQFAIEARRMLPGATVYSFEPVPSVFARLAAGLPKGLPHRAFNLALGSEESEMEMHVNDFSPASSLLPMTDTHSANFTYTQQDHIEMVRVRRLDDVAAELDLVPGLLVKIDVQGFADRVIAGGSATLAGAAVVIVEADLEELYEGGGSFSKVYEQLTGLGLAYRGNWDQLISPLDGRVLSVDAIFMR